MAAKKTPDRMWTRREMDRAEMMRLDGMSNQAIAHTLGRTIASVRGCLLRLRAMLPDATRFWVDLLQEEEDSANIAARMGITKGAVFKRRQRLRKAGYDIPDRRPGRYQRGKA